MATKRGLKTSEIPDADAVSPRSRVGPRSKGEPEDTEDTQSGGMSLDVLAQVASETLENEPQSPQKIVPQKLSMKVINSLEVLTLEQILGLSEKLLISLFSDVESNEIKRNFTYTCCLMPRQCQRQFTSFGSEMRALNGIKKHLYQHLDELKMEAVSPRKSSKFKFTAETVQARKRRIYDMLSPPPAKKKKLKASNMKEEVREELDNADDRDIILHEVQVKDEVNEENCDEEEKSAEKTDKSKGSLHDEKPNIPVVHNIVLDQLDKPPELDPDSDDAQDEEDNRHIEENEQFIIELLSKTQPHHDHNYTTIFGSRKGSEVIHHLIDESDEETEETKVTNNTIIYLDKKGNKTQPNVKPILFLRHRSPNENVPMVSKEEVISELGVDSDAEDDDITRLMSAGPYVDWMPWQRFRGPKSPKPSGANPKTYYRVGVLNAFRETMQPDMLKTTRGGKTKQGRPAKTIKLPREDKESKEGNGLTSENRIREDTFLSLLTKEEKEGKLGWESKLALKFIRELKGKKKSENVPLTCKICRDKTFTATATLMYHYRSHAGIKPFVCLICNCTFTRQHSLNYHMLIHNNQSRFTCKDCGRKFRHPSHFKEHLRRHTGETPFECSDCGQKFKTRNTYKRHLKTRHGKLLTAKGISQMSREEFLKVRTKQYKIPRRLPDISYKMPELHFSALNKSKIARRGKGHVDSEDPINVDDILKTVDEIKEEIESSSDTESAEEPLNNSGAQEIAEKLLSTQSGLKEETKSDNDTLKILETVCADVLTGNTGNADGPEMQFQEIKPRQRLRKPWEKISIEIVEGENVNGSGTVSITVPGDAVLGGDMSEGSTMQLEELHIDIPIKSPLKPPIKVPVKT